MGQGVSLTRISTVIFTNTCYFFRSFCQNCLRKSLEVDDFNLVRLCIVFYRAILRFIELFKRKWNNCTLHVLVVSRMYCWHCEDWPVIPLELVDVLKYKWVLFSTLVVFAIAVPILCIPDLVCSSYPSRAHGYVYYAPCTVTVHTETSYRDRTGSCL